jgi:hypothetical protein
LPISAPDSAVAHRPRDLLVGAVVDRDLARGDDGPVAFLEVGDAAGQRRQRQRIGADEHLAVAIADRQRAAAAGADKQIVLAGEQEHQREGAFQPLQGARYRLRRGHALGQVVGNEIGDRLGVRLGVKLVSEADQLPFQRLEVLDDAVMDDGDPVGRDRVGVALGREAVRCPAGVADADRAVHRLLFEPRYQVAELAFGAAPLDAAVDQGCHPGGIIAAVFETAQSLEQLGRDRPLGDDTDNAAHQPFSLCSRSRNSAARPGLSTWRERAMLSASGGTSAVTTLPVAT